MTVDTDSVASPAALKYLRLQCAHDVGPVCTRKLVEHFGSVDKVLTASIKALEEVEGVGRYRAQAIQTARHTDAVQQAVALAAERGARIICREDEEYPKLLTHTPDPPVCLYVRGRLEPDDGLAIAIVGSRRNTHYGIEQSERFGALLARAGFTVVSGMARGADGAAHRGALSVGGRTVAVLGCGLGHVYPAEHAELAEDIVKSGALVSELPMDVPPEAKNFPPRNRIIVGMSLGVLVTECGKRSGAQISARLASEYNREVFALPGL
ncbi:MAG: DNA-processing protein DprA, partial [Phycisphaerae bacterium]